jgi:hypothetical protein
MGAGGISVCRLDPFYINRKKIVEAIEKNPVRGFLVGGR